MNRKNQPGQEADQAGSFFQYVLIWTAYGDQKIIVMIIKKLYDW